MKDKRILLVAIFAVIIVVGWMTTLKAVSGADIIAAQKELVEEADAYMERKLYVRAIPLYEEALDSTTELNLEIEEKLLNAYYQYQDMQAYIRLVEARVETNDAKEGEYLTVARHYVENRKIAKGMELVKKGIDNLGTETLKEYYEENRYEYKYHSSGCEVIVPTSTNALMAAYNGQNWGYVDGKGKILLPFIYDSATSFENDEYAVVSVEGVYYTILSNGDFYGANDGTKGEKLTDVKAISSGLLIGQKDGLYSYYGYDFNALASSLQFDDITSFSCGVAAAKKGEKWGIIDESGKSITDIKYEDIAINSLGCAFANNRAMVKENGVWHLINVAGETLGNATFADAKAPESDGYIAVANENGRWGFVDSEGELIIDYHYRDAKSFSNQLAPVMVVDKWGYISEKNVIAIEDMFLEAEPFHAGSAQVHTTEAMGIICLEYVEAQQ